MTTKDLVTLWNKYIFTIRKTMRFQILKYDLISYNCDFVNKLWNKKIQSQKKWDLKFQLIYLKSHCEIYICNLKTIWLLNMNLAILPLYLTLILFPILNFISKWPFLCSNGLPLEGKRESVHTDCGLRGHMASVPHEKVIMKWDPDRLTALFVQLLVKLLSS